MRQSYLLTALASAITCLTLSSCSAPIASQAPLNKTTTWQQRQQALSAINNWTIRGAIAVKTPKQSGSASAYWQQRGRSYAINLLGPLGFGNVKITGSANQITLTNAKGQKFHAQSASALLEQQTGWRLPLTDLRYWVRGLPAPGTKASAIQFDRFHHITQMQQAPWTIRYQNYTAVGNVDLPSKIILTNPYSRIVVVISNWSLP